VRFCDLGHSGQTVDVTTVPNSLQGTVVATSFLDRAKGMFSRDGPVAAAKAPQPVAKKAIQAFHAVSIQPGNRCCHEARALQGQRFLSREAPPLPLKNCNCGNCTCLYQHHDDRRAGPRRARDMGVAMDGWTEVDKRVTQGRGRRKTDKSS
jgi:hypothetical protein